MAFRKLCTIGPCGVTLQTSTAEPSEPGSVSVQSNMSMPNPYNFSKEGEPPESSCVSMKSNKSLLNPYYFSKEEPPEPSCVSMKSNKSLVNPYNFSKEEEPPEPSCVSMKSNKSLVNPYNFSKEEEPPEPSCVSMKSNKSLINPYNFSNKEPRCVFVKSVNPMFEPPDLSTGEPGINPGGRSGLVQDQSRCGVCEQLLTDPVSITCGHSFCRQCISCFWNRTALLEDFICPCCRKRSRTCPDLHPHIEESKNQDSYKLVDDVLQRVLQKHKTSMKNRYESLYEVIKTPENRTLLNSIYIQLYIIEGESEGVNEEHEVLQMERKKRRYLQDTAINCSDIFKPVEDPEGETDDENIRPAVVSDLRRNKLKEDEGPKKIRTVLTKGIAGIGKTVSVQKFILDWAEGKANQDVDFMLVLSFRELNLIKGDQYSLHKLLCAFHPDLKDLDPKIYDTCRIVLIFDGLDESRIPLNFLHCRKVSDITMTSSVDVLITNLLKGELLPSAHIWITSRPAAANQIPLQYISRVTEIQGFNEPQKEEYFRKRISDQDQAQEIISHIKTARSLHIMCHIPVFCWISATVLQRILRQSKTEIPKTLTEMYSHFLITQTSMKNEKYEGNVQRNPEKLLESNRTVLLKLAELAFNQLMKGNVMFYEEDLRESGIDLTEASVYSGICTEIFREECVLYQRKVYSFVHLSFQEFLAALYMFHCYLIKNMEVLEVFNPCISRWSENDPLDKLLRAAVDKALKSQNGHLDLFLRFLLGISLESRQKILQGLLIHTESSSESIKKTVQHIKKKIEDEELPNGRSVNLFLCLTEMNDQHLPRKIQEFLKSEKRSENKLSAAECSALCCMLQISEEVLHELDLKKYCLSQRAYMKLLPAVNNCRKALLADCNLTVKHCETLCSALKSENSSLIELDLSKNNLQDSGVELLSAGLKSSHCKLQTLRLIFCNLGEKTCEILGSVLNLENSSLKDLDLSNNDLQDSGVELLSAGLKSSHCKLQTLGLSGCMITEEGCVSLAAALSLNPSHLKELDLTYNHPGESGVKLLSVRLQDPQCTLNTLRVEHGGKIRIKPGFQKYGCDLTLDPNTVHPSLSLSEENRMVMRREELQSYPDHPERFDYLEQVMSRENVTGRCYWEAEWTGRGVFVALSYKTISRKGEKSDCRFGGNINSWCLSCSDYSYSVHHNLDYTKVRPPPSGCRKIGVYVDCPAGTLSFYSVSSDTHTLTHLYTFYTTFTQPLYAGFTVHKDSSVSVCEIDEPSLCL